MAHSRPLLRGNLDEWVAVKRIRIGTDKTILPGQPLPGWGKRRMRRWRRRRAVGPPGHPWTEGMLSLAERRDQGYSDEPFPCPIHLQALHDPDVDASDTADIVEIPDPPVMEIEAPEVAWDSALSAYADAVE